MFTPLEAFATTRDVVPGSEALVDGIVRIREREFVDLVESADPRIAGENRVRLAIDFDPAAARGRLAGHFELKATAGGSWRGELEGGIEGGKVRASGLAVGTGALAGAVASLDFPQVDAHPARSPCSEPKAFFEIRGRILQPA